MLHASIRHRVPHIIAVITANSGRRRPEAVYYIRYFANVNAMDTRRGHFERPKSIVCRGEPRSGVSMQVSDLAAPDRGRNFLYIITSVKGMGSAT